MQHTVHSSSAIPESPLLPLLQCGPTSAAIPRLVSIWSILACHGKTSPGRRFSLDSCSSSLQPSAQTPSKGTNLLLICFLSVSFFFSKNQKAETRSKSSAISSHQAFAKNMRGNEMREEKRLKKIQKKSRYFLFFSGRIRKYKLD